MEADARSVGGRRAGGDRPAGGDGPAGGGELAGGDRLVSGGELAGGDGAAGGEARAARGLVALLVGMAGWAGWFIFRSSLVVDGRRVFCLFDDAMISMTYARNLVEGYGLNWARRGAPVEGFTHPLWTAMMVPVNLLPLALERRALVVQLISLAVLLGHVVLVRRLVRRHFSRPGAGHWLPACVLTAFYYPLDHWALIGMETGLQALLATAMVLLALDIVHHGRDRHLALGWVGAAAVLLRMDLLLLVAAVAGYVWAAPGGGGDAGGGGGGGGGGRPAGRWPRRLLILALPVAALGGYEIFRWTYFHDLLPNTYYLKLAGVPLAVRLLRGASALLVTLRAHGPLLAVVAVGVGAQLWGARRAADRAWGRRLALPAMLFGLCCAYSVYVGGDVWEEELRANRFVAFAMPLVFVLGNALLNQALAAWARRRAVAAEGEAAATGAGAGAPGGGLAVRFVVVIATLAALFVADGLWRQADADDAWQRLTVLRPPLRAEVYEELLGEVRALQKIADPHALVAVTWAGTPAYFSDFRMVDELGYNDRRIARGRPSGALDENHFADFVPGHVKWDTEYVLGSLRPDALLQTWGGEKTRQALLARGYRRLDETWIDPASPRLHLSPDAVDQLDEGDDDDANDGAGGR